jgi:hypothetical protein
VSGWPMVHIPEPALAFGFGQTAEHPKDGLFLYGPPASSQNPARMDIGVIGTQQGVARYERWVKSLGSAIAAPEKGKEENKMMWPGFQAVFGVPWPVKPFGVCYVGLVFKRIDNAKGRDNACCGAQMFLSTGEGFVFKGAVGPWYSEADNTFHLRKDKAAELMNLVVKAYKDIHGQPPRELFIHGQIWFEADEWAGFSSTVPDCAKLVGVRIRRQNEIKLYRYGSKPVLRGPRLSSPTAWPISGRPDLRQGSKRTQAARYPIH